MPTDIDLRPAGANIYEVAGADLSLVITCVDAAGDAVDVSGYTFAADVLRAGTSLESFATAVSGAGSNILTLTLTDTETAAIGTGRGLEWALKVTTGGVDDWWYAGAFQLWEPGKPRPSSSSNTLTAVVGGSITATLTVGVAGLGLTSVDVPDDLNTTGTASASTFLRGDGAWAAPAGGGDLLAANNLSDLADAATARTNLGLGTAATAATGDFATGAEGDLAATALQPADVGTSVQGYDADTLKADTADTLTAGFDSSDFAAGTKSSGTYTPAASDGNFQVATNGGAHTLAPPSTSCSIVVHYTNNGSAGAITTSGFTAVTGDSFTTTDTHEFVCVVTKINDVSVLNVTALQ